MRGPDLEQGVRISSPLYSAGPPGPPVFRPGWHLIANSETGPAAEGAKSHGADRDGRRWLGGVTELRTDRLLLRRWRDSDLAPWAAINADPEVRQHLGPVLSRAESDASVARYEADFDRRG